jgi:hypothetical protein
MKVEIEVEFAIGSRVELNSKMGKDEGVVLNYFVGRGYVKYCIRWSNKNQEYHEGFELTAKA